MRVARGAAWAMAGWCALELVLRAWTGTVEGAISTIGAGAAAGAVIVAARRLEA